MKHLLALLAALCILAAPAAAQTIKSLGFNTTNGQIVAATNVTWTNSFNFSTNTVAAQVRTNLSLGWSALTNTDATNFRAAIGLGATNDVRFNSISIYPEGEDESSIAAAIDGLVFKFGTNSSFELGGGVDVFYRVPIRFNNTTNAATTRTNLGLGSGITTNRTFVATGVTNSVSISNGIITGWTQ